MIDHFNVWRLIGICGLRMNALSMINITHTARCDRRTPANIQGGDLKSHQYYPRATADTNFLGQSPWPFGARTTHHLQDEVWFMQWWLVEIGSKPYPYQGGGWKESNASLMSCYLPYCLVLSQSNKYITLVFSPKKTTCMNVISHVHPPVNLRIYS